MESRILGQVLAALGKGVVSCGAAPESRAVVASGPATETAGTVVALGKPAETTVVVPGANAGSNSKKRKRCSVCGDCSSAVHKHRALAVPLDDKCRKQVG